MEHPKPRGVTVRIMVSPSEAAGDNRSTPERSETGSANQALPAEMSLEPAAAIFGQPPQLRPGWAAEEKSARLSSSFPPVGGKIAGFELVARSRPEERSAGSTWPARGDLAERFVRSQAFNRSGPENPEPLARLQHNQHRPDLLGPQGRSPSRRSCMPFFGGNHTGPTFSDGFRGKHGRSINRSPNSVDTLKVLNDETIIPSLEPRTGEGTGPKIFNPGSERGSWSGTGRPRRNWGGRPTRLRGATRPTSPNQLPRTLCAGSALGSQTGSTTPTPKASSHNDLKAGERPADRRGSADAARLRGVRGT